MKKTVETILEVLVHLAKDALIAITGVIALAVMLGEADESMQWWQVILMKVLVPAGVLAFWWCMIVGPKVLARLAEIARDFMNYVGEYQLRH